MGLIINDEITLKNGMKITGAYLRFGGQRIRIIPGPKQLRADDPKPKYILQGVYQLWISKEAVNDDDIQFLQEGVVDTPITDDDLNTPIHKLAYDYVKANVFPNTTDV